jgi:hypothetical protein
MLGLEGLSTAPATLTLPTPVLFIKDISFSLLQMN